MNIYKIAELTGYSIATVSRVINGASNVRSETRDSILKVIEQTGFTPNLNARDLTSQKSQTLGLVLPGINSYFSEAVEVIGRRMAAHKGHFLIATSPSGVYNAQEEVQSLKLLLSKRVQGVIFFVSEITDLHREVLGKWPEGVSLILVSEDGSTLGFPSVIQNPYTGLVQLFDHLESRGKKSLAFIDGPSQDRGARDRWEMRKDILAKRDFETKPEWETEGNFDLRSGAEATRELLKKPGFDALICANDFMALGAIQVLVASGYKVPEDVAVTGYDDLELTEYSNPPLTTINQSPADLGEEALNLCLAAWEDPAKPVTSVVLDSKLVVREST
jgi:LacI family transcriptional regulator